MPTFLLHTVKGLTLIEAKYMPVVEISAANPQGYVNPYNCGFGNNFMLTFGNAGILGSRWLLPLPLKHWNNLT